MTTQITQAEFDALRPINADLIRRERDGAYEYETITDGDGNEIAFASYRAGQCEGYTMVAFAPGARVEAGDGEDHDVGRVAAAPDHALAMARAANAVWVAWDSGVSTWTPASLLRLVREG